MSNLDDSDSGIHCVDSGAEVEKLPTLTVLPNHMQHADVQNVLTESDNEVEESRSRASGVDIMDMYDEEGLCETSLQGMAGCHRCVPIIVQDYIDLELGTVSPSSDSTVLDASVVLREESSTAAKWKRLSWTFVLFLVCGVLFIILGRAHLMHLLKWLENLPWLQSLLVFILLFTIVSFPFGFGYIILNLMAGYLYGFARGQVVVMVSVAVGFSISFLLCRSWMRDYARGIITSAALKAVMSVVEGPSGHKVMLLMRLTPVPFGMQNVLFAMTSVSYPECLLYTMLGLLPTQLINTYLASTVKHMREVMADRANGYIVLVIQALISIVLMLYVLRMARIELSKLTSDVRATSGTCSQSPSYIL